MRDLTRLIVGTGLLLGATGCDLLGSGKKKGETKVVTTTKTTSPQSKPCAANATYEHLKQNAFDEAKRIRERDTQNLDALADASVIRMENPLLESRDDALGLTVCSGRMILELPPGAGAAFGGRQRLAADVTYSAQPAADGSGIVYKIDGGEPIIYRLASFDAKRGATRTASVEGEGLDTPDVTSNAGVVDNPAPRPRPMPPIAIPGPRAAPEPEVQTPDPAEERARRRIVAERAARAATDLRDQREAAAELRAREDRVAAARRTERGERDLDERPTRTARPSFNCRYARSRVENLICGSNDLAARDREMAALYYRTNDRADPVVRRRLSASRLRFLAYRDRCGSESCVAAAYADRIDEINDLATE